MTEQEQVIWEKVWERMQTAHGFKPMALDLWFEGMRLEKLTADEAFLVTDNDLKMKIVDSKYREILSEDFAEVLGFEVRVILVSTEKQSFDAWYEGYLAGDTPSAETESAPAGPSSAGGNVFVSPSLPLYSPEYTFDNFVEGSSNKMAYTMARAVAEHPAKVANPLFLYGAPGLGKTHLLYAITGEISRRMKDERGEKTSIVYAKGEDFTNELIEALANKQTILFREKYRKADVLLLDDIQFIAGKPTVQEEFFHTYEALFEAGKQIIVTADRLPKDIKSLEERLKSRFEHGVIADIQPPDFELRTAIFMRKAEGFGMNVPNDVLMYLAENIKDNIRQVEGALKKMRAAAIINGSDRVTMEYAKAAVSDILTAKAMAITPEKVIGYVSQKYGVPVEDIVGKRKTGDVVTARQVAMYLLRDMTELSYESVGKAFNRDHSTVVSSYAKIKDVIAKDAVFDAQIEDMKNDLRSVGY